MWLIYLFFILVAVVADESYCNSNADKSDGSCSSNNIDPVVMKWIDELPTDSMYVNGHWVKPTTSSDIDSSPDINVINPSTGQTLTQVSVASKSDVDTAVNTARQALNNWSIDTTLNERRDLVQNLLQLYNKNSEQMAQLISHEMGARKLDVRYGHVFSHSPTLLTTSFYTYTQQLIYPVVHKLHLVHTLLNNSYMK